jgi:hypothetical protein
VGASSAQVAQGDHTHAGGSSTLGTLGYAQVVASQASITTEADLTSLAVTVDVASGRRIRITHGMNVFSSVGTDLLRIFIKEGATQLQTSEIRLASTQSVTMPCKGVILTPSAGSHTYKLTAQRAVGTGNMTMEASAGGPAWLLVEDIGV